jgi:hypothetical protein
MVIGIAEVKLLNAIESIAHAKDLPAILWEADLAGPVSCLNFNPRP